MFSLLLNHLSIDFIDYLVVLACKWINKMNRSDHTQSLHVSGNFHRVSDQSINWKNRDWQSRMVVVGGGCYFYLQGHQNNIDRKWGEMVYDIENMMNKIILRSKCSGLR